MRSQPMLHCILSVRHCKHRTYILYNRHYYVIDGTSAAMYAKLHKTYSELIHWTYFQLPSDLDLHWTSRRVRGVPGRSDTHRRGEFRSDAAALQKSPQYIYCTITHSAEIIRSSKESRWLIDWINWLTKSHVKHIQKMVCITTTQRCRKSYIFLAYHNYHLLAISSSTYFSVYNLTFALSLYT